MKLALRFALRAWRAGELSVLMAALAVAVAAVTTVSFFTDRVRQALATQANQLLAADLVLVADHPLADGFATEATARGLAHSSTMSFPSMVRAGERFQLAEVKAVAAGYPLRGTLRISDTPFGNGAPITGGPAPGTAWVDTRLLQALGIGVGGQIEVGVIKLRIAGVVVKEPDRAGDFFNIAPRLMLHVDDVAASGLIQTGSRVSHRLLLAGEQRAVQAYRAWAKARLGRGERLEGVEDARPEMRAALERAQRYLGLAALVAAVLAAAAVALASRQFVARHLDACAMLRCLGASQATILSLYLAQFALIGLAASVAGAGLGLPGQALLAHLLEGRIVETLPLPGPWPAAEGILVGVLLLFAFATAPLAHLRRVPTLRVLRRDLGAPSGFGLAGYGFGIVLVAGLIVYRAGELKLGAWVLAGLAGAAAVALATGWLLVHSLGTLRLHAHGMWFYGLANVGRRRASSVIQVAAFALGLMALLLLALVRGDLLEGWKQALPPDAPNRFVINIQRDQLDAILGFFPAHGLGLPHLYPMVRGRLIAVNGRPVSARDYAEERAKRLVEREFNLSWAERPREDNAIVAGRWWRSAAAEEFSVETGIAQTLGIRLGDRLRYDIAGTSVEAPVTSLRKVDWDSMRVNFFVVATPALLAGQPASYITSFYLPAGREATLGELVRSFPNVTVIDVAAILEEVRGIMQQVAQAVEFVFLFTLVAGIVVLYAAVVASRDERLYEAAIMRTLGAARSQLRRAQWLEFLTVGALAGLIAATGASATGFLLAREVLNLAYHFNPWIVLAGVALGAVGVGMAGWAATRKIATAAPLATLRRLA